MYRPGSITKITLCNFLTYDECTITPGPAMNMIIGPNGTGKSTIVCAIAIGLGTSTSILGRMKDLGSFIKHGKDRASISISLASSRSNQESIVIGRSWKKNSSTSSEWTLNGVKSNPKTIENLTLEYGIQVDNLCQFLAQDRVSEFAKMDGITLLEETLRAAAPEGTLEQLQEIRRMHSEIKQLASSSTHICQELETMKAQNERIKPQVERIQERETNESKITLLKVKRKWLEYDAARDHFMEIKADKERLKEILTRTLSQLQPFEVKLECYNNSSNNSNLNTKPHQSNTSLFQISQKELDEVQKNFAQLLAIQHDREARAAELENWKAELKKIESALAMGPRAIEAQEKESARLLELINTANQGLEQIQQTHFSNDRLRRTIEGESEGLRREIESINQRISLMENVMNQRLERLKKEAPDSYVAATWILHNKTSFKGNVFLPACVEVCIKGGDWAGEMEELLSQNVLTLIVCEHPEDFDALQAELLDHQRLKVNLHLQREPLCNYATKIPLTHIQKLGFQGYLADFVEAPEPVKAALCQTGQIHWLPVGKGPIKEADLDREIVRFCADGLVWGIYGGGESGNESDRIVRTKRISQARVLGIGNDGQKREELQSRLSEIREHREVNRAKVNEILEQQSHSKQQEEQLTAQKTELVAQRREIIAKINEHSTYREKKRILSQRIAAASKKKDLQEISKIFHFLKSRISSILPVGGQLANTPNSIRCNLNSPIEICKDALSTKHRALIESEIKELREKIEQLQSQLHNLVAVLNEAKAKAKELLHEAQAHQLSEQEKRELESAPGTLQELDTQIHRLNALLDLHSDLDENTLVEYTERCKTITKNIQTLQEINSTLEQQKAQVEELTLQFSSVTTALVDLINVTYGGYFSRLSCVGQVALAGGWTLEPGNLDSDKWSLEILVKFRESAELAPLSPHRQSGGERSVSTFLYLLSLQGLSRAPFRVVDEINQGMDAHNEARMHSFMVEATAANEGGSQCFVVTPKLLCNLSYGPGVRVLCVFNGDIQG
jgi:chromosome segregation ATPase